MPQLSFHPHAHSYDPVLVILSIACTAVGWQPDAVGFADGLLGFAIIAVFGTALALLFSAANVFFRDFSNVVQTLTNFVRFSVPMIYPFTLVPASASVPSAMTPTAVPTAASSATLSAPGLLSASTSALSLRLVTLTAMAWVSLSAPSLTCTTTSYTLLAPASPGAS